MLHEDTTPTYSRVITIYHKLFSTFYEVNTGAKVRLSFNSEKPFTIASVHSNLISFWVKVINAKVIVANPSKNIL